MRLSSHNQIKDKLLNAIHSYKLFIIVFLALFLGLFYGIIVFKVNVHGDAKFHTLYARNSAETGKLVESQPYSIYSFNDNQRVYNPIAYPLGSEALFTLLYTFGGENALKLYSPLMAVLIFLLIFLLLRDMGELKAAAISSAAVLAIGERLFMTPLIEPLLASLLLASLLAFKKYFSDQQSKYLCLAALFAGAAMSVKQQGLAASLFMFGFLCIYTILKILNKPENLQRNLFHICLFATILFVLPSLAFLNQYQRNGTLAFAPGKTSIPGKFPGHSAIQTFFTSNFPVRDSAVQARDSQIGYNKQKLHLIDKTEGFILAPFLYYRANDVSYRQVAFSFLFNVLSVVILLGLVLRLKERKSNFFWLLVIGLLTEEILTSTIIKTPIHQYHTFGIILAVILIGSGVASLIKHSKIAGYTLLFSVAVLSLNGYFTYARPLWSDEGREDAYHISAYENLGNHVQASTPKDAVFLAAETTFRYYARRDTVWFSEDLGDRVKEALTSTNPQQTLQNLKALDISYVVIDKGQLTRAGVYDFLPKSGLNSIIDHSAFFQKEYDAMDDGQIVLYKVNYSANV